MSWQYLSALHFNQFCTWLNLYLFFYSTTAKIYSQVCLHVMVNMRQLCIGWMIFHGIFRYYIVILSFGWDYLPYILMNSPHPYILDIFASKINEVLLIGYDNSLVALTSLSIAICYFNFCLIHGFFFIFIYFLSSSLIHKS